MTEPPPTDVRSLKDLIALQPGESLYGVVDGAQDLELAYEAKCLYGQEIRSLFEGDMAPALADVAPYLVPIDPESGYLDNWQSRLGKNAGVLFASQADYDSAFRHLRYVFVVKDERGQEYFFRYYDPRVISAYLKSCTPSELSEMMGPFRRVWFETDEGTAIVSVDDLGRRDLLRMRQT